MTALTLEGTGRTLPVANTLLRALSAADLALLGPMQRVTLPLRAPLEAAGEKLEFAHFIEGGVASVVASTAGTSVEIGVIGREGMTGVTLIYGDDQSTFTSYMQVAGSALRIEAGTLSYATEQSPALKRSMLRYAQALSIQTAATAFANGHDKLEGRLARWLLMIGDRMGPTFDITHEFMSIMLAVRRSGVTLAVQELEGKRLIIASRGSISIRDRPGLQTVASKMYGVPEREYARLFG